MDLEEHKSRPIHDVLNVTKGMLYLQTQTKYISIPYWKGDPGIGKSALAAKLASDNNMNFFPTHFGQTPIEEISGLPYYNDFNINDQIIKGTSWTIPDILTQLNVLAANNKIVIWLLDDFHLAPQEMMQLGYEMFTEKKLRGYPLPSNVAILLAGNTSVKAGSKKNLFSAIVNRCAIFPVHMDFNFWKKNFAIPYGINPKIISFLSNTNYKQYIQEEEQLDKPWASYRSWTNFSNILNPLEKYEKIDSNDILYYCSAHCGTEAASKFTMFYDIFSKVNVEKIFEHKIINIPEDLTDQYIYMFACTYEFNNRHANASQNKLNEYIETFADIIIRMANKKIEIALMGLKEISLIKSSSKKLNDDLYIRLKTVLNTKDPKTTSRLEDVLKLI